ncbi:MAG: antibiotic biosynthesis monooxygenase [Zymomonas mobilis]|uniref:Heme-degrading monooxygenase HmoA n=1 Tax=Zymomonas mobilis TaxID=542 RepID=A0A542W0T0_ZYMMB|nr:antibiotic biosynthesis monooxygenase family protein [Zymomonas mobilis]TQL17180.1 heme-degrading monooxygenase HmoA [Zymomonas mobilis]
MIYEFLQISIKENAEDSFIAAVEKAKPLFLDSPGCEGMTLTRSHEHKGRFCLVIRWESIEAHVEGFRKSDALPQWRALVNEYFSEAPKGEHLIPVFEV